MTETTKNGTTKREIPTKLPQESLDQLDEALCEVAEAKLELDAAQTRLGKLELRIKRQLGIPSTWVIELPSGNVLEKRPG